MATNIYQRGTVKWWRRSVTYRSLDLAPIMVRISLRTSSPGEAKARAAFLETEFGTVEAVIEKTLKTVMTQDDLKAVYHTAFKAALDRYILKQASMPMFADTHAASNLVYARYFTLLTECLEPPEADENLRRQLQDKGMSEQDAEALFLTVAQHGRSPAIGFNYISDYLRQSGVKPTDENLRNVGRAVASAYRNACLEASAAMGRPIAKGLVWPIPSGLEHMLGIKNSEASQPGNEATSTALSESSGAGATPQLTSEVKEHHGIDVRISELAAAAIKHKTASGEWREDRDRDVNAAVALFIAANGDLMCSEMRQRHVSAMTALFPRLPTRYGHLKSDLEGGIAAALQRGDALRVKWKKDSAKAERDQLPTVGLSAPTHNKHLTWLSALVTFAEGHGYVVPAISPAKARAKVKKIKGPKRPPWAISDLHKLFQAPVWTGCAGLWQRFTPGNLVIHDGAYWGLLLVAATLGRSEEPSGLMLDDIFEDASIPYVWFRDNPYRLLKNGQSDRKLPICPQLVELGFLDFVRAMRRLGHDLLFPEFNSKSGFDHEVYDKVFEPLRKLVFPQGTSAKQGRKDVDVHSIRSRGLSVLRDLRFDPGVRQYLSGHVPDGETAASYEENPSMEVLLPLVTALGDKLLPKMQAFPLNLRPREWQKFGSPRGRRTKSAEDVGEAPQS